MKVYILNAETVTDVSSEVFDSGYTVGVFSTYAAAEDALAAIGENYTRGFSDYSIEEIEVK